MLSLEVEPNLIDYKKYARRAYHSWFNVFRLFGLIGAFYYFSYYMGQLTVGYLIYQKVIFYLLALSLFYFLYINSINRISKQMKLFLSHKRLYEITGVSLVVSSKSSTEEYSWNKIDKVLEFNDGFIVIPPKLSNLSSSFYKGLGSDLGEIFVFPKNAFASDEEVKHFREIVSGNVAQKKRKLWRNI